MAAAPTTPFGRGLAALETRDARAFARLLDAEPELVHARGDGGNDLLGVAVSLGDEQAVALLLARGADPAHANVHGWTALHQATHLGNAGLAATLLSAGAPAGGDARGAGGTPLVVALVWGQRETAELVAGAEGGLTPVNLRVAAGLGRLDLIERLVGPDGRLAPEAGSGRGFYRPHGGFPAWVPGETPAEIRDEAVAWAARNDRAAAVALLAARGGSLERDVYRGTPLAWAAACGALDAAGRLIALGADPNGRTSFGGPGHGEDATPLHLAAESGRVAMVELLLAAGADRTLRDGLHRATPAEWAEHASRHEAAARLLR